MQEGRISSLTSWKKASKKGSVTVHLCLILSAILFLVATFADLSFAIASRPYAQEVLDLAGRSVLSEYNKDLKDRYGLFFFQVEKEELRDLFTDYIGASFKKPKGKTDLLALNIGKANLDTSEYSATDCDILMEQIMALMKYQVFTGASGILDLVGLGRDKKERQNQDLENDQETQESQRRKLRNGRIIKGLPSNLLEGQGQGLAGLPKLPITENFGQIAYEEVCLNKYIVDYFNHKLKQDEASFFTGEIEYILTGNYSDDFNLNTIYISLLAYRSGMNALHISRSPEKMELVRAAALILGEGVATPAVEAGLIALWAGAEAALDLNHLEKGGRVPLLKKSHQWRLGLASVLEGIEHMPGEFSTDEKEEGLDYEDYLFLFLCFKSRDTKLVRIMDLIHLNMKGHYDKDFSYSSCSAGFQYHMELERKRPFLTALFLRKGQFYGQHKY